MFGGNFAPKGWEFCDGRLLSIPLNETLFNLIGTTYGGDGESTYAMPDLRGRLPLHQGSGLTLAQTGGDEEVTLNVPHLPIHSHALLGSTDPAGSNNPQGNVPASLSAAGTQSAYGTLAPFVNLDPSSVSPRGGTQPHSNEQPFLCVSFIIAKVGIFPTIT